MVIVNVAFSKLWLSICYTTMDFERIPSESTEEKDCTQCSVIKIFQETMEGRTLPMYDSNIPSESISMIAEIRLGKT